MSANYADTIAMLDQQIEQKHREIDGLTQAKAILQELHDDTPTQPRRSGGRGKTKTKAKSAKANRGGVPGNLRADPGADGVCDHQGRGEGCRGAVEVVATCDAPGCAYKIRRCSAHDGGPRGVPILLGVHRGHHRRAGDAVA